MLEISYRTKFKKELKAQVSRGKDFQKFIDISKKLASEEKLASKHYNHKLSGEYKDRWQCHIEPDWLIIHYKTDTEIVFERTGSDSDLFK